MRQSLLRFSLPLLFAAAAWAQTPTLSQGGVLNAASFALPGLPNSAIAQGSIFTAFGSNLGPATLTQVSQFPLPTTLGGTSVQVTSGGQTLNAPMLFTVAGQVAAILPSNTPVGQATLRVTFNGQQSNAVTFQVARSAFGTFTTTASGTGVGAIQNFDSASATPQNSLTQSARPGQTLVLYGTGLGPITGSDATAPTGGTLRNDVQVSVGGQNAPVSYAGRVPGIAGQDQINFTVPQGVSGCYVPVSLIVDNVISNFTTISVAANGGTCSDPIGRSAEDLRIAQQNGNLRTGNITLARSSTTISIPGLGSIMSSSDVGSAAFLRYSLQQLLQSNGVAQGFTSIGSCFVFQFRGQNFLPGETTEPTPLDAGPTITITGPRGTRTLTREPTSGLYSATLGGGGNLPGTPSMPEFLDPGSYTITNGSGGSGANRVGSFSAQLTIPAQFRWTNEATITSVNRSQGLNITYTGGDPAGFVSIFGVSVAGSVGAGFACTAPVSTGQFTVPREVLLALPVTGASVENVGLLGVNTSGNPVRFSAEGLDYGFAAYTTGSSKTVRYQ